MQDDAENSGDDLEGLLQAIADRAEAAGEDAGEQARQWLGRASHQLRVSEESATKIIQALREQLSVLGEPSGHAGEERAQPVTTELVQDPTGLAQYQSLAMLAAVIWWFSRESGRTEAELLDLLATNFRH